MSGLWRWIFGLGRDDYEKKLKHISKEEASLLARIRGRSHSTSRNLRLLLLSSATLEVVAISYAISKLRSLDSDWVARVLSFLPTLILPGLSVLCYWSIQSLAKILERKDQKKLERLQAERQAKIDELKQKTNFYTAQQLIQRYDPDPMTQAAAASIMGSKLVAESGSKVCPADEAQLAESLMEIESENPSGMRKRRGKESQNGAIKSEGASDVDQSNGNQHSAEIEVAGFTDGQLVVSHYDSAPNMQDCGWMARIMSLLVSEDHTESCPLICGNCRKHNGLARKEDFPSIMYYCPHCHALNRPKNMEKIADHSGFSDKSLQGSDIGGAGVGAGSLPDDETVVPHSSASCVVESEENASEEKNLPTVE